MTTLITSDGLTLQHRWDGPDDGAHVVVFCHPHPQQGGTMTAPLMQKVTEHLTDTGMLVLRFNYRGVGTSEGDHGYGIGELHDVDAAMSMARGLHRDRVSLIGWSFGAAMALRWQAGAGDAVSYVGIAPPAGMSGYEMPQPHELAEAERAILIGERDQLIDVETVRAYAESIGARFEVLPASDHFFHFREQRVAEFVLTHLTG